eukprot:CAMPEP_0117461394 /NCGR_PEP_ID=MMETSP0784-20121206/2504_1 /TAXON_ID=39447 /ORGANISM="" /LENGTH=67 /DNA_ID=CAMNT_0005255103 /DNA_START=313 /DNA_END=519 /DNA_ORIENTATION=+
MNTRVMDICLDSGTCAKEKAQAPPFSKRFAPQLTLREAVRLQGQHCDVKCDVAYFMMALEPSGQTFQ